MTRPHSSPDIPEAAPSTVTRIRETFATRLGILAAMMGVAVGLGNVWRFPYMVGRFGGAAFFLVYLLAVLALGIPAMMTEWTLGRSTGRGPVGAYEVAGVPYGRWLGWAFFAVVTLGTGHYSAVVGWVFYHGFANLAGFVGADLDAGRILLPEEGFSAETYRLELIWTGLVVLAGALILSRGIRRGVEVVSRWLTPFLFVALLVLVVRAVTLAGSGEGVEWFLFKFEPEALTPGVVMAAVGQVAFSIGVGGTLMVVYGSHLGDDEPLAANALWTALGDTGAGLLAGLAVFPAVFALGFAPAQGPGLIFSTLPGVFDAVPGGAVLSPLFFLSFGGVAFLSALAAYEVLVSGLVDYDVLPRKQAVWVMAAAMFSSALIPMINQEIFIAWDLTFASGTMTAGGLIAVLTVGWAMDRERVLRELASGTDADEPGLLFRALHFWIRWVIPAGFLALIGWWLARDVLGLAGGP